MRHRTIIVLAFFLVVGVGHVVLEVSGNPHPESENPLSTQQQISDDLKSVPCRDRERLEAARQLFLKMGAVESDLQLAEFKKTKNLVLHKPGKGLGLILLGAHYDKANAGCGAIDNWSGIVALAHLYKSLRPFALEKTLLFVAFGGEEEGLLGSKGMVKSIDPTQYEQYCAMVNLDSLGMGIPQASDDLSTKKLVDRTALIAARLKIPFARAKLEIGSSDSLSFLEKKIPSIDLHELTKDYVWILHHDEDQAERAKPMPVYLAYRLAFSLVAEIEKCPCSEFR